MYIEIRGIDNKTYLLDLSDPSRTALVDVAGNALIIDSKGIHFISANCSVEVSVPFANTTASPMSSNKETRARLALERRGLTPCLNDIDAQLTAYATACNVWDKLLGNYGTLLSFVPAVATVIEAAALSNPVTAVVIGGFWGVAIALTTMCKSAELPKIETEPFGIDPAQVRLTVQSGFNEVVTDSSLRGFSGMLASSVHRTMDPAQRLLGQCCIRLWHPGEDCYTMRSSVRIAIARYVRWSQVRLEKAIHFGSSCMSFAISGSER